MTPSPTIVSSGDHATNVAVGRDYIKTVIYSQEIDFEEVDLEGVKPPKFDTPSKAESLAEELYMKRALLLAGSDFPEKRTLALHLAWLLQGHRPSSGEDNGADIQVKEWIGRSEIVRLDPAFRAATTPTVFLLDQIRPHHLAFNPQALVDRVRQSDHFVIMTTDSSLEEWSLTPEDPTRSLWRELTLANFYDGDYLGRSLAKALGALGEELPSGIFPDGRPQGSEADLTLLLVKGITLEEAGKGLGSPDRIRAFADWLSRTAGPIRQAHVRRQIQALQGGRTAIGRWFRLFDRRMQHFIVGATLLDGLLEDQLFAALEVLLEKGWRERDPLSSAFDHDDLHRLGGYFRRLESRFGGARVTCSSRQQHRALLQVAWESHRRQILAALPALVHLADGWVDWHHRPISLSSDTELLSETGPMPEERPGDTGDDSNRWDTDAGTDSDPGPAPNRETYLSRWQAYGPERELWGTFSRRSKLLSALAETLSDLGTLSLNAVDRALIELSSNPQADVRRVAAVAMASWREEPEHAWRLFHLLTRWNRETRERSLTARGEHAQGLAGVRSTIVQVVGHAAQFDRANNLAPQLRRLLEHFAQDPDPAIQDGLKSYSLPRAVAFHRRQLEPQIQHWVQRDDLVEPVARGWAEACSLRPEEGLDLLTGWWEWLSAAPPAAPQEPAGQRERCLVALVATYEVLSSMGPRSPLSIPEILRRLGELLGEHHPDVRVRVIRTFALVVAEHLDTVPEDLQRLLSELSLEERQPIVEALTRLYLRQRAGFHGGDYTIEHLGTRYQLWARPGRPRTTVEQTLEHWLADADLPEIQQLALAALTEFRCTPVDREERRVLDIGPRAKETLERAETPSYPADHTPVWVSRLRQLMPLQQFLLWLATLQRASLRKILKAPVPELIEQDHRGLGRVSPVLVDLQSQTDLTREIGRYLERFRRLYEIRSVLWVGAVILAVLLMSLLM